MYGRLLAALMLAFACAALLAMAMAARAAGAPLPGPRQVGVAQAVPELQTVAEVRQALRSSADSTRAPGGHPS